ncbi:MAG: hypothetical protein QXD19_04705 [Candidatus Bathyarchaeia archaeon]
MAFKFTILSAQHENKKPAEKRGLAVSKNGFAEQRNSLFSLLVQLLILRLHLQHSSGRNAQTQAPQRFKWQGASADGTPIYHKRAGAEGDGVVEKAQLDNSKIAIQDVSFEDRGRRVILRVSASTAKPSEIVAFDSIYLAPFR